MDPMVLCFGERKINTQLHMQFQGFKWPLGTHDARLKTLDVQSVI